MRFSTVGEEIFICFIYAATEEKFTNLIVLKKRKSILFQVTCAPNQETRQISYVNLCIPTQGDEHVEVLGNNSHKTSLHANGTLPKAGQKTRLNYNIRDPATDGVKMPVSGILSPSKIKIADVNYVPSVIKKRKGEVQVFTETVPFNVSDGKVKVVMI